MEVIFRLLVPIYLPMSVGGFTRRLLINFTYEKQNKKEEYFLIQGLKRSAYLSGWAFTYYCFGLLCSVPVIAAVIYSKLT
jgi:hypothetical protein